VYDTIIIGAGMSGLAAGIRAAYFDQRVCILERHTTIGGLNSFYRLGGRDYDVGLHAVTNFTSKGYKRGPLALLLRQLRLRWEDFALAPQIGSSVVFPGVELEFSNDIELLKSEIAQSFPAEVDNFERLLGQLIDYDDLEEKDYQVSTRQVLSETFGNPILVEMLLCPVMWYGNAREDDMDFAQFCIMFRSIFLEGFARPFAGVRLILRQLVRKFRSLGGELKLRSGVASIRAENGRAVSVVLDNGEEVQARNILSSVGMVETLRLCDDISQLDESPAGQLSFTETISILDQQPQQLGHNKTIVFYNDSAVFDWSKPQDRLVDLRTGVICSPNNFVYSQADGELADGVIRVTSLASFDRWDQLDTEDYQQEKRKWYDQVTEVAAGYIPDFRNHVIDTDMFTPTTIRRFTWHDNGAVYGAVNKQLDGTTHLKNLFLCGTDQGYVGIVGTIVSGISMANRHLLQGTD